MKHPVYGNDVRRRSVQIKVWMTVSGLAAVLAATAPLPAQAPQAPIVQPSALKHGRLVVWVVHPGTAPAPAPRDYGGVARRPPGYSEQTAGTFGQTASQLGTSASNVGLSSDSPQIARTGNVDNTVAPADRDAAAAAAAGYTERTAGNFGQPASTFGTDASNHGQSPSTVGQNASNVGTEASNYGQNASNYGHSLSTIAQAAQPTVPEQPRGVESIVEPKLRAAYPDLTVQFVSVASDKLSAQLRTAASSPDMASVYPDVLVFEGFPASWEGPPDNVARLAKETLGGSSPVRTARPGTQAARRAVVTMRSRRQPIAIAFAEYLQNEGLLKLPVAAAR
jgi:hypothetical protein